MLQNVPAELRILPHWCAARENGAPVDPKTGHLAKVDDPSTWGTFEQAVATGLPHVGFVFSVFDPYTAIDLDNKETKPAGPADLAAFDNIKRLFATYTEVSRSGRGWHLVCKGNIGMGRRRGHVEVYSSGRFIILTGNGGGTIEDRQELLTQLVAEMPATAPLADLDDTAESHLSDAEIIEMGERAANGDKFLALCNGDLEGYPSQSEADLAFLSMLAFYTSNNEQVRRIFRSSPLGKREKAQRNDTYINYALAKIRGKEPPPIDTTQIVKSADDFKEKATKSPETTAKKSEVAYQAIPEPPGFLGELARYFQSTTIRPVSDISLAAAIGIMAGIAGRAYNVSGTGLNQYLLLLAPTGTGKEGIQDAIDVLVNTVRQVVPSIDDFIGPAMFASGQALIRTLAEKPGFVSVIGEFGLFLQQMSDSKGSASNIMLRKVLLDIYGKSGASKTLRSSVYSDSEKNTKVVQAPALTILGESTPGTFFDWVSPSHIAEGLIPRFLVIHYTGPRPPMNPEPNKPVPQAIIDRMVNLATVAITAQRTYAHVGVTTGAEAKRLLDNFNVYADEQINARRQDVEAELWNRAHLKALKLSALLAVCDNPNAPDVSEAHATWAINLVRKDITAMAEKFFTGDVGNGDSKQLHELQRLLVSYFETEESKLVTSYAIPAGIRANGVIPYVYLSRRTMTLAAFRTDPRGATFALKRAIEELVASGQLQELPQTSNLRGTYSGRAFVVRR